WGVWPTNTDTSSLFPLSRGTRQGCPLSPLLFALAVEPLAIAIRAHPAIEGIMVENEKPIISLYADDIILYLTNVTSSLPALCTLLDEYSCISGYKINKHKSVVMPLNPAAQGLSRGNISFHWEPYKLCYLGVQIPNQLHQIYFLNYEPLLKKTEADLERWKSLPISLIGRINCMKMNVLPKFLYLFQALISRFLRNGKVPRVKLKTLCRPTEQGGLNLPDFKLYYLAAQSRAVWTWIKNLEHPPAWKQIEQSHTHFCNNCDPDLTYLSHLFLILTVYATVIWSGGSGRGLMLNYDDSFTLLLGFVVVLVIVLNIFNK
uniref:Reverse transcriptase domain-containing protein n=1 Tax=Sander lucioperca TaxID=283035 RepID=A0A8C9YTJ5_SANLU